MPELVRKAESKKRTVVLLDTFIDILRGIINTGTHREKDRFTLAK